MTTNAKPITAEELANIRAYITYMRDDDPARGVSCGELRSLVALIDAQARQIEEMGEALERYSTWLMSTGAHSSECKVRRCTTCHRNVPAALLCHTEIHHGFHQITREPCTCGLSRLLAEWKEKES
jgi:hypothetical protein